MKKTLSIVSIFLCLVFTLSFVTACNNDNEGNAIKDWESNEWVTPDSALYRDYYQIFVYSYCDSNGDGIGDLKGIESKLDYIADLGFTGIWLSPIHPSSTEHCYDVEDYYNVNSKFGTMQDFDDLVAAAHERGISIMLDLVINHTSNKHPWFLASQQAWKSKNTANKYYDYYTFLNDSGTNYKTFEKESSMPKLNLESAGVRAEIDDICKFWLQGHDVDAFRLDAAWHFYEKNVQENIAFMRWLTSTAQQYNPDVYMVGEVWTAAATVYSHYATDSVQSFFNFDLSAAPGYNSMMKIINVGQEDRASRIASILTYKEKSTANGIDALFASNHDTSRISNMISYLDRMGIPDDTKMELHKMSVALLYTQTGNVFNYYGNEIGMRNGYRKSVSSDYTDYTYRTAMYWGLDAALEYNDGFAHKAYGYSTRFGEYDDYLGGVAEQKDDQNSLLNFYRRVMWLRRQNPEIAQGKSTFIATDDSDLLVIVREYKGSKILMVYNLNASSEKTFNVSDILKKYGMEGKLAGFLSSNNDRDVTMSGNTVTLPQFSIAVIR